VDTELEQRLNAKIKRADRVIIFCIIGLFVLVIIMFCDLLYQNQKNADLSRIQDEQNHKRTQQYIRCVAETLTISYKQPNALDICTKAADDRTKEAEQ
jgi:hypothetical protein